MNTLEIMRATSFVRFVHLSEGSLLYECVRHLDDDDKCEEVLLRFRVPLRDAVGGTFLAQDKPGYFMRWIHQAVAEQDEG